MGAPSRLYPRTSDPSVASRSMARSRWTRQGPERILRGMTAPRIVASATAVPRWRWEQPALLQLSRYEGQRAAFFANSQIDGRYLYLDPESFTPDESVDQLSERYQRGAIEIGEEAVRRVLGRAGWA